MTRPMDPFMAFRFEVSLDDLAVGGFSECSGLSFDTEVTEYLEGGLNAVGHKFPGRTKQGNLVMKRGIVDRVMWDWYADLLNGAVTLRDGAILLYDPAGAEVVMEWAFAQAFPCKWGGPDLNAQQTSIAVETLELCHQGLRRAR